MRATLSDWSHGEFGHAGISDHRWRARLVGMAMQAARCPAGRITEVFSNDAQRQGAYGLLESEAVGHEQIAEAMFVAKRSKVRQGGIRLLPGRRDQPDAYRPRPL
jgi:hypothetical protein